MREPASHQGHVGKCEWCGRVDYLYHAPAHRPEKLCIQCVKMEEHEAEMAP